MKHCNHRLCPWCAPRRATRLKDKLRPLVDTLFTCKGKNGTVVPRMMTFTQDDRPGEALAGAFRRMLEAFKRLRRQKRWKHLVRGGMVSLEVTRNQDTGSWHTHLHLLVDVDWYEQEDLLADWREAMGTTGLPIGGARIEPALNGIEEVVKYVAKGIEVSAWSPEELQELVAWMRGKRMLRTFGHMYRAKVEEEETPEIEQDADGEEFYDPSTGVVCTKLQLHWRSDANAQAQGWNILERRWSAPGTAPPGSVPGSVQ